MIEITSPDFLSQEETETLNRLRADSLDACAETLGNFTARQVAHYLAWPDRNPDFDYIVWACSVTWGFETLWAGLHLLEPQQLQALIDKGDVEEPPPLDSLELDTPLKKIHKWAPQDHLCY